jgi:hypothetical protein
MRYFLLLPLPMTLLPGGIIRATRASGLVLLPGSLERLLSGSLTAITGTITLATITATTDDNLGMAAATLVEATRILHRQKCR